MTTQNIFDLTDTWNDGGTTFTALKMNVTDTASDAASLLMDLQVGGVSQIYGSKSGQLSVKTLNCWDGDLLFYRAGSLTGRMGGSNLSWAGAFALAASNPSVPDVYLYRDAANTLALRNSTNAQTFRAYHTYTDASNGQWAEISTGAAVVTFSAETQGTGADDIDVALTPAGTGVVQFGTHAAIGAESVTGYITIKDAGGTTRKLAVVS